MRRLACLGALAAALAMSFPASAKNPWEELMGRKPRTWSDPQGRFHLDLPVGWSATPRKGQAAVDFWKRNGDYGAAAHVTVTMKPVPPKVNTRHFAVSVNTDVRERAPGYRLIREQRLRVSGVPAIRTHFTYQERNNAQLVNEVEQYVLIVGERAFVLTFEHALGARGLFQEDFSYMVKGFVGRSPGEEGIASPKKRRKVRAGEMVNPDVVRY